MATPPLPTAMPTFVKCQTLRLVLNHNSDGLCHWAKKWAPPLMHFGKFKVHLFIFELWRFHKKCCDGSTTSIKNVVHWNRSYLMVRYIREKHTYMWKFAAQGPWGIFIVLIGLTSGLFQEGRGVLSVCSTQSCLEPTVTGQTGGSTSSASRHFRGKTTKEDLHAPSRSHLYSIKSWQVL